MGFVSLSGTLRYRISHANAPCDPRRLQSGSFIAVRRCARIHRVDKSVTAPRMESEIGFDVPAGVLLAISSVLAIASVGCGFELSSGHPQLGYNVTLVILLVSLPGFITLYYAALQKGKVEADED